MQKHIHFLRKFALFLVLFVLGVPLVLLSFYVYTKAAFIPANIRVDAQHIVGPLNPSWKALAQGGEEKGVRMLENVRAQMSELSPRYIRIDHIYDFYDVVARGPDGRLIYDFTRLDQTVCDIYAAGARPFFSLGYMPAAIARDGNITNPPTNWNEWRDVVERTIEHYSGRATVLCGGSVRGEVLSNIYYEVWNEPDLETFGKWSIYGGDKDYKTLYAYAEDGATRTTNVHTFFIGGPSTTAPYKNWMQTFVKYIREKDLRLDFISWHRYSKNADDYLYDMNSLREWLQDAQYGNAGDLPKIVTEWGFDPANNPDNSLGIGAAHAVASIRNFIDRGYELAFSFEAKDGPASSFGVLRQDGSKKPRFEALLTLNLLEGELIFVEGEGSNVRAIATKSPTKTAIVLVNYDSNNRNYEAVPLTVIGLEPGIYTMTTRYTNLRNVTTTSVTITDTELKRSIIMPPNSIVGIELIKP